MLGSNTICFYLLLVFYISPSLSSISGIINNSGNFVGNGNGCIHLGDVDYSKPFENGKPVKKGNVIYGDGIGSIGVFKNNGKGKTVVHNTDIFGDGQGSIISAKLNNGGRSSSSNIINNTGHMVGNGNGVIRIGGVEFSPDAQGRNSLFNGIKGKTTFKDNVIRANGVGSIINGQYNNRVSEEDSGSYTYEYSDSYEYTDETTDSKGTDDEENSGSGIYEYEDSEYTYEDSDYTYEDSDQSDQKPQLTLPKISLLGGKPVSVTKPAPSLLGGKQNPLVKPLTSLLGGKQNPVIKPVNSLLGGKQTPVVNPATSLLGGKKQPILNAKPSLTGAKPLPILKPTKSILPLQTKPNKGILK